MVKVVTTVQQIMTCLRTAQTEGDRLSFIIREFYSLVSENKGHIQPSPKAQHT